MDIEIPVGSLVLPGILSLPKGAKSLVIFAHGSGSSRLSPRNTYVARVLEEANMGTLLFDLLTEEEDSVYENRFNIELIAERLIKVTEWLLKQKETKNLALGYFGSSTGSASAIQVAAALKTRIKAVVSRGGRPDLALDALGKLKAPTLLIVGGDDLQVIELNQAALAQMHCVKELTLVPGATHLFEEPGTLEQVAKLAAEWFKKYL